jgi:hypothetical protein
MRIERPCEEADETPAAEKATVRFCDSRFARS